MRSLLVAFVLIGVLAPPASAQVASGPFETVTVTPGEGVTLSWNGHRYAGTFEIKAASDGLVLVNHVTIDDYLLGIQEVPFSWPEAALEAQAVAARTYLLWTIEQGRAGAGRTYGFDICASSACQVYGGLDQVEGTLGHRWESAVQATAGEVLLVGGKPAMALYSSTAGERTRSVQDVFDSRSPVPYLQAVPSPGEESPFVTWSFEVRDRVLEDILHVAGLVEGDLRNVTVQKRPDGAGPWQVIIETDTGIVDKTTPEFRRIMNRWAAQVRPDLFPAPYGEEGRRYPQTVLSSTYTITKTWHYPAEFTSGFIDVYAEYRFDGEGWGHQVGLSQYGAKAMADRGASYGDILAHYYGGIRPQVFDAAEKPVAVGLAWGEAEIRVGADGPVTVTADGAALADAALGTWTFRPGGGIVVEPPEGLGLPPTLASIPDLVDGESGRAVLVAPTLTAPAEVRMVVFRGARVVAATAWKAREAGKVSLVWDGLDHGSIAVPGRYRLLIEARSPEGRAEAFATLRLVP